MGIDNLGWPLSRVSEALETLARHAGLNPASGSDLPRFSGEAGELGPWVHWASERIGAEALPVEAAVPDFGDLLQGAGPALLRYDDGQTPRILLLLTARSGMARLIGPDQRIHYRPLEAVRAVLCARCEAPYAAEIDRLLARAGVPERRRPKAKSALLRERLSACRQEAGWILRLPPGASAARQAVREGLHRRIGWVLAVFMLVYGLEIAGWRLIGRSALDGRLDGGWFSAWIFLVLSLIPLELLGGWMNSVFALDAGRLLKQRLLAGALAIDVDAIRRQGSGQLLGQVIESQALESLALNGGLSVLVAVLELAFAGWVMAMGAGGGGHVVLVLLWLGVVIALGRRHYRRVRQWTEGRLDLTHVLVERMVGHRTCLAQGRMEEENAREDRDIHAYLDLSGAMDRSCVPLFAIVPRGWLLLGMAGLAPAFAAGTGTPGGVAVALGGVLLAERAFGRVSGGIAGLIRAMVAWGRVRPLFHAAELREPAAAVPPGVSNIRPDGPTSAALLEAQDLRFRYGPQGDPVLRGGELTIHHGERILLEGPSGGGKSTLAALLVGLRRPESGMLLLGGLDRPTLGESWRQRVTAAPQFHENHVLSGTFAFNLLMGRRWPATHADLEEADALCRELGLGDLLDRMPAGLMQMVGETGWQLSHGERSRLYLARALLQKAELTVLDESFAALDPENLEQCLNCALKRASTLMVIAHP